MLRRYIRDANLFRDNSTGKLGLVELLGASGEISALMGACGRDSSPAGIRDAALIAVLYGAGLRRSESVGLDLSDYNIETGEMAIRGAKGRKDRLGYATNGSADALKDWLVPRGGDRGPLFCNINKERQNHDPPFDRPSCAPRLEKARRPSERGVVFTARPPPLVHLGPARRRRGHFDGATARGS
jgi:integrase